MLWIGVIAFVLFLLLRLPASLVTGFIPKPWQLGEVSGTVWHGRAAQFGTNGQLLLSNLRWDWQPSALLRGTLRWQVAMQHNQQPGQALVDMGIRGAQVSDVHVTLPLAPLLALDKKLAPLQIGGDLNIDAKAISAKVWDGVILQLNDAHSVITPQANPFGSYRIETQRDANGINWHVAPLQGTLTIQGQGSVANNGKVQGALNFVPSKGNEALFTPLMQRLGGSSSGYTLQLGAIN
uniref:type II secretion system protein N n=1 Tax=Andreprevotia chitinilytica TaxID=396808 RepID=UPI0014704F7A|nr:type II secretion system protein N [Andreprevotia chitinilytica]